MQAAVCAGVSVTSTPLRKVTPGRLKENLLRIRSFDAVEDWRR
jgi:hypothetical protein